MTVFCGEVRANSQWNEFIGKSRGGRNRPFLLRRVNNSLCCTHPELSGFVIFLFMSQWVVSFYIIRCRLWFGVVLKASQGAVAVKWQELLTGSENHHARSILLNRKFQCYFLLIVYGGSSTHILLGLPNACRSFQLSWGSFKKKDQEAVAVQAADSVDSMCQGWASRPQAMGSLPVVLCARQAEVKLLV